MLTQFVFWLCLKDLVSRFEFADDLLFDLDVITLSVDAYVLHVIRCNECYFALASFQQVRNNNLQILTISFYRQHV